MTSILPGKFDGSSDLATWLREFDACSLANDWKEEDKIKKLPAFFRGPAASHFYAIPADDRKTYKDAVKMLIGAMCPTAQRENFYAEFEARTLRPGEDPAVYKWDLEQKLLKADPLLDGQAKEALLLRQFMRGLPRNLKIRMLENDPAPTLANMIAFVQRYRAVQGQGSSKNYCDVAESSVSPQDKKIDELVTMVNAIPCKQQQTRTVNNRTAHPTLHAGEDEINRQSLVTNVEDRVTSLKIVNKRKVSQFNVFHVGGTDTCLAIVQII